MKIWISIFLVLILLILTSKIKVNILSFKEDSRSVKFDFDIALGIYLFGFIKFFSIHLKKDGIHFFWLVIPYKKIKLNKDYLWKDLKSISFRPFFKKLNVRIEKWKLNLQIGTENVMFTAFSVFLISTSLSIFLTKNSKKTDMKKFYYHISPLYNTNMLSFQIASKFSINTVSLFKAMYFIKHKNNNKKAYKLHIKQKSPVKI